MTWSHRHCIRVTVQAARLDLLRSSPTVRASLRAGGGPWSVSVVARVEPRSRGSCGPRPSSLRWHSSPWPAVERRRARPRPASAPAASGARGFDARQPGGSDRQGLRAFATEIEEPWDGVIRSALEDEKAAGRVDYSFRTPSAIPATWSVSCARSRSVTSRPSSSGTRSAARKRHAAWRPSVRISRSYSARAVVQPSLLVFDNWIHEPAYLAGMLAGGLTKSNTESSAASPPGQSDRQRLHRRGEGSEPEGRGEGHLPQ